MRNMARYYVLSIEPTLFNEPALVREWGRIGRSSSRRIKIYNSRAAARVTLEAWLRKKVRRGYAIRVAETA